MSNDTYSEDELEHVRRVVDMESSRYIADIGLLSEHMRRYSIPVSAYIMCASMALPVKTIIVGERPYATDIHPHVSSAMSYDPAKSRPTPSTVGVANDVNRVTGYPYVAVEEWFRDGWTHLKSGVVIVNCTVASMYSSSQSINETVSFQRWLRCIIECSSRVSEDAIDVVCMGVPSQNIVDSTLSSMDEHKSKVRKKVYPNPASWTKASRGDTRSHQYTFGKTGTSRSILSAINRSTLHTPLTVEDYIEYMSKPVPSQLAGVNRLMEKGRSLVDLIEEAYSELESNHKKPALREAYDAFSTALVAYRDSVLYDIVRASASQHQQEKKIGKNTEWGSKAPWSKPPASVGESTRMSAVPEDTGGVDQTFDDGENVAFADDPPKPEMEKPDPPKKKKVVKKLVPRRPKASVQKPTEDGPNTGEKITKVGGKLSSHEIGILGSSIYFISEIDTEMSSNLREKLDSSMAAGAATDKDVCTIVDAASLDLQDRGKAASDSLGLEDGNVSADCILPKLLNRLCGT